MLQIFGILIQIDKEATILKRHGHYLPKISERKFYTMIKEVMERLSETSPACHSKEIPRFKVVNYGRSTSVGSCTKGKCKHDCALWPLVSTHRARQKGITSMYQTYNYDILQMM